MIVFPVPCSHSRHAHSFSITKSAAILCSGESISYQLDCFCGFVDDSSASACLDDFIYLIQLKLTWGAIMFLHFESKEEPFDAS